MSLFSTLFGRIKNNLSDDMAALLLDLSTGNSDRSIVVKTITWDAHTRDEQINLSGINPTGPAAAPTADPDGEGWLFSGASTDNVAILSRQINHDAKQGSVVITPHIHWRKTTAAAGNASFRCEYKYAPVGGDFAAYVQLGTDQKLPIAATVDNNSVTRHLITSFGDLTLPVGLSTMLYFKLTRVASDTANDTYGADALVMTFDYHYGSDSPGSRQQYIK